jgi:hypothetical protein
LPPSDEDWNIIADVGQPVQGGGPLGLNQTAYTQELFGSAATNGSQLLFAPVRSRSPTHTDGAGGAPDPVNAHE